MKTQNIGIVGDGCVATHFMHYLDMEKIPYNSWSRSKNSTPPNKTLLNCDPILLLISDDKIEEFIIKHPEIKDSNLIHFSGSLNIDSAFGFHPLMTFSKELYSLSEYRIIPFIGEDGKCSFQDFFPTLKNPFYVISREDKPLYHALCVISGNFTNILWQKTIKDFETKLSLPREVLKPYLNKTCENIMNNPFTSLTGPIKRGDVKTIKRNKKALNNRLWQKIYSLFNKAYKKEIK